MKHSSLILYKKWPITVCTKTETSAKTVRGCRETGEPLQFLEIHVSPWTALVEEIGHTEEFVGSLEPGRFTEAQEQAALQGQHLPPSYVAKSVDRLQSELLEKVKPLSRFNSK